MGVKTERVAKTTAPFACAGKSIIELLYDELFVITERLMTGAAAEDGKDPGRAEGIAFSIAFMLNPYRPDIQHVKNANMLRWEREVAEDEPAEEEVPWSVAAARAAVSEGVASDE